MFLLIFKHNTLGLYFIFFCFPCGAFDYPTSEWIWTFSTTHLDSRKIRNELVLLCRLFVISSQIRRSVKWTWEAVYKDQTFRKRTYSYRSPLRKAYTQYVCDASQGKWQIWYHAEFLRRPISRIDSHRSVSCCFILNIQISCRVKWCFLCRVLFSPFDLDLSVMPQDSNQTIL